MRKDRSESDSLLHKTMVIVNCANAPARAENIHTSCRRIGYNLTAMKHISEESGKEQHSPTGSAISKRLIAGLLVGVFVFITATVVVRGKLAAETTTYVNCSHPWCRGSVMEEAAGTGIARNVIGISTSVLCHPDYGSLSLGHRAGNSPSGSRRAGRALVEERLPATARDFQVCFSGSNQLITAPNRAGRWLNSGF